VFEKCLKKIELMTKKTTAQTTFNLVTLILLSLYILVSFGRLQRIRLSYNIAFYVCDFLAVCLVGLILISVKLSDLKKHLLIFCKNNLLLGYFFSWSLVSLVANQMMAGFSLIPWLYWVRLLTYLGVGFGIKVLIKQKKLKLAWVQLSLGLNLGLIVLLGILQYWLIPDLRFLGNMGWDVHYYRLAGSLLDPNFAGMILVMILISVLYKFNFQKKWLKYLLFGTLLPLLLLTYSRSSYGSFLVSFSLILIAKKQTQLNFSKKIIAGLIVGFMILMPFLPKPGGLGVDLTRTETIASRVRVNQIVLQNIEAKDVIIGKGMFVPTINIALSKNNLEKIVHAHFPDNLLVFLLSATGLPGLILACIYLGKLLWVCYQRQTGNFLLILSILLHSLFNLTIFEPINLLILLLALNTSKKTSLDT